MSYQELEEGYRGLRRSQEMANRGWKEENENISTSMVFQSDGEDTETEKPNQIVVGVCAMHKKSTSGPMTEIIARMEAEFSLLTVKIFNENDILNAPISAWPRCDCLITFHSKGFPLIKAKAYVDLWRPLMINDIDMQYCIQDRREMYRILKEEGIRIPRYAVLDRDGDPNASLVEFEDHIVVNGELFNKPFVEKPISAEDHNIYIYYPISAGGGSQRLFRKIGSRSSVYSPESKVRRTGSYLYEDFMATDGTDVKVYTVGPDYAHAEARKSPALDGKVERDTQGKEIRYPVILSNEEKLIARKVCLAFKQTVCGFDLLRADGKSYVCDVNGFSFVKNSKIYYDDCAKILANKILRTLAPTMQIPWSVPFQLDDPPIVSTTVGKMMELRCVVGVIRHGDRTPKQKMKVEVRHRKFFQVFEKHRGIANKQPVKLKKPADLQEILDITRCLLKEIERSNGRKVDVEIEEKRGKFEQLKSVLEMYGHFSGINRKVQLRWQPHGRPRGSSSDDGTDTSLSDAPKDPSLVLILKWGGELTPAGRLQAEELGRIFRCMYPGGQGEYSGNQGLGLLRLHSTYRHDLKIYASDEGRVQMTAAAFAKGLLALEGELTPIMVQMVKSANTDALLDMDNDSAFLQNKAKDTIRLIMQKDDQFSEADKKIINPCGSISIDRALEFVSNPFKCCEKVLYLIDKLMLVVITKKHDPNCKDIILYHGESWELMYRRWGKVKKDFYNKQKYDISKIPDIYDCIKYDLQHNRLALQFEYAEELYINAKYLADIVIPQEYGITEDEKLAIGKAICTPLLKKIRSDLQRNIEEVGEECVNRLNPHYSSGVSSPGRHVRTRLYFTSESHVHSLMAMLRFGNLVSASDKQWNRAMEYVSMVSELNYMSQIVIMLYEDPTKHMLSDERFHVELHFSPGVNCCVQKELPPGPGFRPQSRNEIKSSVAPFHKDMKRKQKLTKKRNPVKRVLTDTPSRPLARSNARAARILAHAGRSKSLEEFLTLAAMNDDDEELNNSRQSDSLEEFLRLGAIADEDAMRGRSKSLEELSKLGAEAHGGGLAKSGRSVSLEEVSKLGFTDDDGRFQWLPDHHHRPVFPRRYQIPHCHTYSGYTGLINIQGGPAGEYGLHKADSVLDSLPHMHETPDASLGASSLPVCSSTTPICIPRTVPLYLESTNDYLPDSPSLKYLQISPENNAGSCNFPEVTFSNLVAVKQKNVSKESNRIHVDFPNDELGAHSKKSGSIPSNFTYSDGAFSGRMRKISNTNAPSCDSEEIATILESPERLDLPISSTCRLPTVKIVTVDQSKLQNQSGLFVGPSSAPSAKSLHSSSSSPILPANPSHEKTGSKASAITSDNPTRHRHSVAGHNNFKPNWTYFGGYGISVGPSGGVFFNLNKNKLLASTNCLFSTAVISGSSSAPNLRDSMPSSHNMAELGGVPQIRSLETLHNALSLRQLDEFLHRWTFPGFSVSTPPKVLEEKPEQIDRRLNYIIDERSDLLVWSQNMRAGNLNFTVPGSTADRTLQYSEAELANLIHMRISSSDDETDRTITRTSDSPRESVVGFFDSQQEQNRKN